MGNTAEGYKQSVVVGAAVVHGGRILLLQRAAGDTFAGLWELPSGGREPFEKVHVTLARELAEESSLHGQVIAVLPPFEYQVDKGSFVRDTVQINFLVLATNPDELKLSTEHSAAVWIGELDLPNYAVSDETRAILTEAFAFLRR